MSSVRASTNVWFFSDDASVPDKTGAYCERLTNDYRKLLSITSKDQDWIPYVVVDSNSASGVYLGWEWSNGRIAMVADKTPTGVLLKAGNRDDFRTDLAAGETFVVPPGFLGLRRRYRQCGEQRAELFVPLQYAGDDPTGCRLPQGGMERLCGYGQRTGELGSDRKEVLSLDR